MKLGIRLYVYKGRSKYSASKVKKTPEVDAGMTIELTSVLRRLRCDEVCSCGCSKSQGQMCGNENANASEAVRGDCLTGSHRPPRRPTTARFCPPAVTAVSAAGV